MTDMVRKDVEPRSTYCRESSISLGASPLLFVSPYPSWPFSLDPQHLSPEELLPRIVQMWLPLFPDAVSPLAVKLTSTLVPGIPHTVFWVTLQGTCTTVPGSHWEHELHNVLPDEFEYVTRFWQLVHDVLLDAPTEAEYVPMGQLVQDDDADASE